MIMHAYVHIKIALLAVNTDSLITPYIGSSLAGIGLPT